MSDDKFWRSQVYEQSCLVHYTVQEEPDRLQVHRHDINFELSARGLRDVNDACADNLINDVGGWDWSDSVIVSRRAIARILRTPPQVVT